jgi:hypothetical protein
MDLPKINIDEVITSKPPVRWTDQFIYESLFKDDPADFVRRHNNWAANAVEYLATQERDIADFAAFATKYKYDLHDVYRSVSRVLFEAQRTLYY